MKELILAKDPYKMNWIQGRHEWGDTIVPSGIQVDYDSQHKEEHVIERFVFTNITDYPMFLQENDIGIYCTFNDSYDRAQIALKERCHTHIWCGENVSYIKAVRMGGEPPHLGLVLSKGSLSNYSVEREEESNDRGDFIVHPSPFSLDPGEKYMLEWVLFSYMTDSQFLAKQIELGSYIKVEAEQYLLFNGEELRVKMTPMFAFDPLLVSIRLSQIHVPFEVEDGIISVCKPMDVIGEHLLNIEVNGVKTHAVFYVQETFDRLLKNRLDFIVSKQQYTKNGSPLDGAFLIYDMESESMYYSTVNDHNGSRERIGMGVLLAKYLQNHHHPEFYRALTKYLDFIERELFDAQSGRIYNDIKRKEDFNRLYNYPWFSTFFLETYRLTNQKKYLTDASRIMQAFYQFGGETFYAIDIHMTELIYELEQADCVAEADQLKGLFIKNADRIMDIGMEYPCHEVKYEQSIVAPAAWDLLEANKLKAGNPYLESAKTQIRLLELFNGHQPDYRLYQTAIRHWDGYWFGKRKTYGDTFPHYWSALSGNVFLNYYLQTGEVDYLKKADRSLRGVLSLFRQDGFASCAYLYPLTLNGNRGKYEDPWANDQDWGMYFYYCYRLKIKE